MKKIVMVVELEIEVPENVDTTLLHLGNSAEDFLIEECGKKADGKVLTFCTTKIIHNTKELIPFCVLYRDENLLPADPPFVFQCQAENSNHAQEQCLNAKPGCYIVWAVEDCEDIEQAYDDYYE